MGMINTVNDMGINLLATGVAFSVGLSYRRIYLRIHTRPSRRFWKPLERPRLTLVLGAFDGFDGFEPSGIGSIADAKALQELMAHFTKIHLSNFEITYASKLTDGQLEGNVVCFCAPDGNEISRRLMQRRETEVIFTEGGGTEIKDKMGGNTYTPKRAGGVAIEDFGVIICMDNPYSPSSIALIVAGVYGFATWAGVRLLQRNDFLESIHDRRNFAAVFRVDVIQNLPQSAQLLYVRDLPPNADQSR